MFFLQKLTTASFSSLLFAQTFPSVFLRKEKKVFHINKIYLHAFHKLSTDELPTLDCHYKMQRNDVNLLEKNQCAIDQTCSGFGWDWVRLNSNAVTICKEHGCILATVKREKALWC